MVTTPFGANAELGWEDDLDRPRSVPELVEALESTWRLVTRCLHDLPQIDLWASE